MAAENDVLTTGTLFWVKSGERGSVPVRLEILTEDQKQTLRSGLERNRYSHVFETEVYRAHLEWVENYDLYELLVADIRLSPEQKRKLRPPRKSPEEFEFRFTLSEMSSLKKRFENGEVDDTYVRELLVRQPWKPWEKSEWKRLRDTKIQDSCENCGETTGLVLQHTRQPRKVRRIAFDLVRERIDQFEAYKEQHLNEFALPLPENTGKVPVCPKCGSSRVRYRQRKGNYVCEKTRNAVICRYEFTTPEFGIDERTIRDSEKKRVSMLRERFCSEQGIYRVATAIALEEIISYLNLDHVKTLCRVCAFKEDRLNLRLCEICRVNYHWAGYKTCRACAEKMGVKTSVR